jgi:hypothetical protein
MSFACIHARDRALRALKLLTGAFTQPNNEMGATYSRGLGKGMPECLTKSRVAFAVARSRQRCVPSTLLELCLQQLASNPEAESIGQMSNDLVQLLFDILVDNAVLTKDLFQLFKSSLLWRLHLGSYPGLESSWLAHIHGDQLITVDLSHTLVCFHNGCQCNAKPGDRNL